MYNRFVAKKESPIVSRDDNRLVCKHCPIHVPMCYDPMPDDPNTTPLPSEDEVMTASRKEMTRKAMLDTITQSRLMLEVVALAMGDPDQHDRSEFDDLTSEAELCDSELASHLQTEIYALKKIEKALAR